MYGEQIGRALVSQDKLRKVFMYFFLIRKGGGTH